MQVASLFFFHDTTTTEIYTLSLHDALPILLGVDEDEVAPRAARRVARGGRARELRSEEHTSELQSRENLVCRLLLEKKKHDRGTYCLALFEIRGEQSPRPRDRRGAVPSRIV